MAHNDDEDMEGKIGYETYKIWKKNVPHLYDVVVTHALEWPSLSVQWLPEKVTIKGKSFSDRRLILGTHTSDGEQNHLMLAKVSLPGESDEELDKRIYNEENEAGGHGHGGKGKIEIIQRINHNGEVNRARYMPQNPCIIATKGPSPDVYVFDYTRHPSQPKEGGGFKPDLTLHGHKQQGYGMAWNAHKEGRLLSGSGDGLLCMWDVNTSIPTKGALQPLSTSAGHRGSVEDVAWHVRKANVFGSVGDDKALMIWDDKEPTKATQAVQNAHTAEVNCIAFSPHDEQLLLTGSADKTVKIWDLRKINTHLHCFESHTDTVNQVQWSPSYPEIFASAGADSRVCVWNSSRIGDKLSKEALKDGPPELMFVHAGHLSRVSDCCWDANDPWMMASVAEDNMLHVWQMDERIYLPQDDGRSSMIIS